MGIDRRIDRGRAIIPGALIGLVAIAGHFRIKKFYSQAAVFTGTVVADPDRTAAEEEARIAMIETKAQDVRLPFRPHDHFAIRKSNHKKVVIVPRHGSFLSLKVTGDNRT